uniref:BTB domain-containing protein n=1 Tax=Oryzias latipes TaxID=8090 RepID=A0A3B3I6U9_ORYLA
MEEMSGESVVSTAVPAATTLTAFFKGSSPSSKYKSRDVLQLQISQLSVAGRFTARVARFTNSEGWILIDRCGKHFGTILNYLRDGAVPLPDCHREIEELLAEAKYYLVQGLSDECTAALQNKETYEPLRKVLVQGEPGYEYPMLFLSCKLQPRETRYSTIEKQHPPQAPPPPPP